MEGQFTFIKVDECKPIEALLLKCKPAVWFPIRASLLLLKLGSSETWKLFGNVLAEKVVCLFGSPGLRLRYVYLCFLGLFPPPQSGGARPTDVTFPLTFLHTRDIAQPCLGPRLAARR